MSTRYALARHVVLALSLLAGAGCGKTKPEPAASAGPVACQSNDDCAKVKAGMVCLARQCADRSTRALYDDNPSNAVTPEKVQREVEQRQADHEQQVDRALETP